MAQTEIKPTSQIQWQQWKDRVLPEPEQIAPNVWSVPTLIPNHPMRYTISYALVGDNDEIVVIDTSWPGEGAWESFVTQFQKTGLDINSIKGAVITHQHPDHHGLSGRLKKETGAWVAMHPLDSDDLNQTRAEHKLHAGVTSAERKQFFKEAGIDQQNADMFAALVPDTAKLFAGLIDTDIELNDGDIVDLAGRKIEVVWTPGHTPGSICFFDHDNNILFTGDHILPRISPNVGMHHSKKRKPLSDYMASLKKTLKYEGAEIAPAHEYRFNTLELRINDILQHHEERLTELANNLQANPDMTLWQIASGLTWSRGWEGIEHGMKIAALSETEAHLDVLADRGNIAVRVGDDGAKLYSFKA